MYRQHFGFAKRPFDGGIARDGDVYLGPPQRAALANPGVALSTLDSVAVLTGPAGVGKTTLAWAAFRADNTRIALGWLGTVPSEPADLPELLLAEFGVGQGGGGRIERLQTWRQFLSEMGATESRVLVIVEHAEELSPPVLRTLESLTAADPNGCPGANVVLTGQPQLQALLAAPALEALRQRVRLRQPLAPLDRAETAHYLRHRIDCAGRRSDGLFTDASLDALHAYSEGVPRVLNNLCESALALAAAEGKRSLEPELIVHVAEQLFGLGPVDERALDVPVLTDAIEIEPVDAAPFSAEDVALLADTRLEARRTAGMREERLTFAAPAEALAADRDVDEFAATALLRASRA